MGETRERKDSEGEPMNPNPIKTHKRCGGVVDVLSCTSCGAFPLEDDDILTISTENPNTTPEEMAARVADSLHINICMCEAHAGERDEKDCETCTAARITEAIQSAQLPLQQALEQSQKEMFSEQERRVAAQEAITSHWQPRVERLEKVLRYIRGYAENLNDHACFTEPCDKPWCNLYHVARQALKASNPKKEGEKK